MPRYLSYEKWLCYTFDPWVYLSLCISSNFKTIAIRERKGSRQRMPSRNDSNLGSVIYKLRDFGKGIHFSEFPTLRVWKWSKQSSPWEDRKRWCLLVSRGGEGTTLWEGLHLEEEPVWIMTVEHFRKGGGVPVFRALCVRLETTGCRVQNQLGEHREARRDISQWTE